MNRSEEIIGRRRYDGEGSELAAIGFLPAVPKTGERKGLAAFENEPHWDSGLDAIAAGPLVKAVAQNEAAPMLKTFLEAVFLGNGLCPGVDHLGSDGRIFAPRWDEAPLHELKLATAFLYKDRSPMCRRNVILRCEVDS